MKKKKESVRTTRSFTITVPVGLLPEIKRRAFESGLDVSSYLTWLIRQNTGFWQK
jgi:predicted DNA binding CopG/RHH family protein